MNTCRQAYSQTPQANVVVSVHRFGFLEAVLASSSQKRVECDLVETNGPAANRTRVSSVQARYSTTRLRARLIGTRVFLAPTTK
jgi:hypothetical protein